MEFNFVEARSNFPLCTGLSLVCEESVVVRGVLLLYRLWSRRTSVTEYAVEIATANEARFAFLGRELVGAAQIFSRLVKGTVTPNTLDDILADLAAEAAVL